MSVTGIRSLATGPISEAQARQIIDSAQDEGGIDAAEKTELAALASARSANLFETPATRHVFISLYNAAITTPATPATPAEPRKEVHDSFLSWTTTYFPMVDYTGDKKGSPESNLWAEGGAADLMDQVLQKMGKPTGARAYELQPATTGIVTGGVSGGYLPTNTVNEKNAEVTTGLDLDGDGKITEGVVKDIIGWNDQLVLNGTRGNGKTDDTVSLGWWGHCDEVGAAGTMFREPVKEAEFMGVKFSPTVVKGLLSMISQSQGGRIEYAGSRFDNDFDSITLKTGEQLQGRVKEPLKFGDDTTYSGDRAFYTSKFPATVTVELPGGETKTFRGDQIRSVNRELEREDAAMFHTKMSEWLASGRPAVMDKDQGQHLWNYNWHKFEDSIFENGVKPEWAAECDLTAGFQGAVKPGDKVSYVSRVTELGGQNGSSGSTENYRYWVATRNGKIVNSGWAESSRSPDFLWRPSQQATFTGSNGSRNPFIDPAVVKQIYLLSISDADRAIEERRLGITPNS